MRSNTPVTLTHHTTPPPLLPPYTLRAHQHPKRASLMRRVVGLVWRRSRDTGRTGRWRESQCGMRSPPYQHTRPTYQHNHLVLPVLPPNQRSQSLSRSRKFTKQFKKSNQNTNGGAPRFKQALSVPTQNRNTSRQDFQFSLLPATSVARGKKLPTPPPSLSTHMYPDIMHLPVSLPVSSLMRPLPVLPVS